MEKQKILSDNTDLNFMHQVLLMSYGPERLLEDGGRAGGQNDGTRMSSHFQQISGLKLRLTDLLNQLKDSEKNLTSA
jgi:hypothetical protein